MYDTESQPEGNESESLQAEIAEEAATIYRIHEEEGTWRCAQDCWLEAIEVVLARHGA